MFYFAASILTPQGARRGGVVCIVKLLKVKYREMSIKMKQSFVVCFLLFGSFQRNLVTYKPYLVGVIKELCSKFLCSERLQSKVGEVELLLPFFAEMLDNFIYLVKQ